MLRLLVQLYYNITILCKLCISLWHGVLSSTTASELAMHDVNVFKLYPYLLYIVVFCLFDWLLALKDVGRNFGLYKIILFLVPILFLRLKLNDKWLKLNSRIYSLFCWDRKSLSHTMVVDAWFVDSSLYILSHCIGVTWIASKIPVRQ